jgi:hypothetical protein
MLPDCTACKYFHSSAKCPDFIMFYMNTALTLYLIRTSAASATSVNMPILMCSEFLVTTDDHFNAHKIIVRTGDSADSLLNV